MRDFLTFSWARFSKDVHSHTLQIAKILSAPVPKPGELIKLDASPGTAEKEKERDRNGKAVSSAPASLEMICRMPGGLDFGKGLVDVNFQMWPLFCCLSLDNILTCCEIALSPTGRVLFTSRHPAMLGVCINSLFYDLLLTAFRLPFRLSSTSLNSVVGVELHFRLCILAMPRSTSRILDHGFLGWPPKHDTLRGPLPRFASVICKSIIYFLESCSFFLAILTMSTAFLHRLAMSPPRTKEIAIVVFSYPHSTPTSTQTIRFLQSSKKRSQLAVSDQSSKSKAAVEQAAASVLKLSIHQTGGTGHVWLLPLTRFFNTGYA